MTVSKNRRHSRHGVHPHGMRAETKADTTHLSDKFSGLKHAGGYALKDLKLGLEAAWRDLKESVQQAGSRF